MQYIEYFDVGQYIKSSFSFLLSISEYFKKHDEYKVGGKRKSFCDY